MTIELVVIDFFGFQLLQRLIPYRESTPMADNQYNPQLLIKKPLVLLERRVKTEEWETRTYIIPVLDIANHI